MRASRALLPSLLWLALMVVGLWIALVQTPMVTDLSLFLPQDANGGAQQLLDELRTGPGNRVVLIALEGGPAQTLADASRALAARLRGTGRFVRVANGAGALTDQDTRWLFTHRYLLSPSLGPGSFSPDRLREALEDRLRELRAPVSLFDKRWLARDPTGEMLAVLRAWRPITSPALRHGVWFSAGGTRALLLAEARDGGLDPEQQARMLAEVRQTFAGLHHPGLSMVVSGAGVLAAQSRTIIRREVSRMSIAASLVVVLILLWAYRSVRLLLLSTLPLVTAIVAAVSVTGLLFDGIHGIALAFGTTLLGVAIDYPIHLFSHLDAGARALPTMRRIWPTLRLGVVTSAAGYTAMLGSELPGLAELGTFAITGLLAAAACTRYVLPYWVPEGISPHQPRSTRRAVPSAPLPVLAGILVLAAIALLAHPPRWQDDPAALSPLPGDLIATDRTLRRDLGAPEVSHLIAIHAGSAEQALRDSEALLGPLRELRQAGAIQGFDLAARYLPSQARQRALQRSLPDAAVLASRLHKALAGLPFKADLFKPFLEDVAGAHTAPVLTPESVAQSVLGLRIAPLLFQRDGQWTALVTLSGVRDGAALAARFAHLDGGAGGYVDLKQDIAAMLGHFRDRILDRLAWGAVLIAAILGLGLRSARGVLRVLLPVALALTVELVFASLLDLRLTIFHLVSLLLVVGVGLDYSLFFNRAGSGIERDRTVHAIAVCVGSTAAVFGILGLSELPVLKAIGQTVAFGVVACFGFSYLAAAAPTRTRQPASTERR